MATPFGIGNWTSHVGSPAPYALHYDILKDLQPISLLAGVAAVDRRQKCRTAKDGIRADCLGEIGAQADHVRHHRRRQRRSHVRRLFRAEDRRAFQYVPYRGGAPAMQDLIGARSICPALKPRRRFRTCSGRRFKAFAVMGEQRWPKSPDTPTMIESGMPGLSISFWHGLWTTKGTPKPIVDRLNKAVMTALADPSVRERIENLGQVIFPPDQQNPAALAAYHKRSSTSGGRSSRPPISRSIRA